MLHKANLLEDLVVCAKFFENVEEVVHLGFFANHLAEEKRVSLFATMQKTLILATETMHLDYDVVHAVKKTEVVMESKARSASKMLKS